MKVTVNLINWGLGFQKHELETKNTEVWKWRKKPTEKQNKPEEEERRCWNGDWVDGKKRDLKWYFFPPFNISGDIGGFVSKIWLFKLIG